MAENPERGEQDGLPRSESWRWLAAIGGTSPPLTSSFASNHITRGNAEAWLRSVGHQDDLPPAEVRYLAEGGRRPSENEDHVARAGIVLAGQLYLRGRPDGKSVATTPGGADPGAAVQIGRQVIRRQLRSRSRVWSESDEIGIKPTQLRTGLSRDEHRDKVHRYDQRAARPTSERTPRQSRRLSVTEVNALREATEGYVGAIVGDDIVVRSGNHCFVILNAAKPNQPETAVAEAVRCGQPASCLAPVVAAGRCKNCYEYRRSHRGEERPRELVERTNRRYDVEAA